MSRNLRHKPNATPTKKTVRRSSAITETTSDDDDYAGVDAISSSEEDEPDVEEVEEQAIIESEDEDDLQAPRPSIDDDQSSWGGFDDQEEILGENTQFFEDHIARGHAPDHDTEAIAVWNNSLSEEDIRANRRVHFAEDSSSSEDEENAWPDLFVPQGSLDPSFRRAIESNDDDFLGGSSDGEGSYWDFNGEESGHSVHGQHIPEEVNGENDEDDRLSDSSAGSSGYETDDGETTEEDLPPAARYVGPGRSVLRRPSTDSGSEEEITVSRRTSFGKPKGPMLGHWIRDRSKPFVLLDDKSKKLIMFKAEINPRRWSMDATNARQNLDRFVHRHDSFNESPMEELSPMISNSGNLMMSAMHNGIGSQAFGPPEAFFPFTNIDPNGNVMQDSLESYDEDDADDEELWVLEDIVDFGVESDADDDEEDAIADLMSTPARPTTATSDDQMHPLLANPHLVGAFRNNQDRHQLLSRNKVSRSSLAFAGPLNHGPIRGIKDNRLAAANTPITPVRRQKPAKATLPSSPASPLVQHSNKRKASNGEEMSHKRSRSMV